MTSIQGHKRLRQECPSVTPSVVLSDSSLLSESGDKLFNQLIRSLGTKPPIAIAPVTITNVPKYSESNLQKILKAVSEA